MNNDDKILHGHYRFNHTTKQPEPIYSIEELREAFRDDDRVLEQTKIGTCLISTVFLCIDHSYGAGDGPVLFETMIFAASNHPLNDVQFRHRTYDEAVAGHWAAVRACEAFETFPANLIYAAQKVWDKLMYIVEYRIPVFYNHTVVPNVEKLVEPLWRFIQKN